MERDRILSQSDAHAPTLGEDGVGRLRIFAGDVATSVLPVEIDTLLGSCVAVCLFDPKLRGGGMNHIMLRGDARDTKSTRLGINAMELLINDLLGRGGVKRRFIAKAFGGASVLHGLNFANVGDDNVKFVEDFLAFEKIPLVACRMGGVNGVHLYFRTDTGDVRLKSLDGHQLPDLIRTESSYRKKRDRDKRKGGEIMLF